MTEAEFDALDHERNEKVDALVKCVDELNTSHNQLMQGHHSVVRSSFWLGVALGVMLGVAAYRAGVAILQAILAEPPAQQRQGE